MSSHPLDLPFFQDIICVLSPAPPLYFYCLNTLRIGTGNHSTTNLWMTRACWYTMWLFLSTSRLQFIDPLGIAQVTVPQPQSSMRSLLPLSAPAPPQYCQAAMACWSCWCNWGWAVCWCSAACWCCAAWCGCCAACCCCACCAACMGPTWIERG